MKPTHKDYKQAYKQANRETYAHKELENTKREYIKGNINKKTAIQKFNQIAKENRGINQ